MKFWEAMRALEEGKKVRFVVPENPDHTKVFCYFNWEGIFDTNWELCEEPEKLSKEEDFVNSLALLPRGQGSIITIEADMDLLKVTELLNEKMREKNEKQLTFAEVVKGLKEGKRFKRKDWGVQYIHLSTFSHCIFRCAPVPEKSDYCMNWMSSIEDFEATDWVEVR